MYATLDKWSSGEVFKLDTISLLLRYLFLQVGVYATLDKWSSGEVFKLDTIFDVMFNLGFLLIIIGGIGQVFSYILFHKS
jgi:hypothetical protein